MKSRVTADKPSLSMVRLLADAIADHPGPASAGDVSRLADLESRVPESNQAELVQQILSRLAETLQNQETQL